MVFLGTLSKTRPVLQNAKFPANASEQSFTQKLLSNTRHFYLFIYSIHKSSGSKASDFVEDRPPAAQGFRPKRWTGCLQGIPPKDPAILWTLVEEIS